MCIRDRDGRLRAKAGIHSWVPIVFGALPVVGIVAAIALPAFMGKLEGQVPLTQPEASSTTGTNSAGDTSKTTIPAVLPVAPRSSEAVGSNLQETRNLAERGQADAQYLLGQM